MKFKVKKGMGGSKNGKSRTEKTEVLKKLSKKARRTEGKKITNMFY
jgi:hypothetical protein|tara:strand:- start:222 stop:359 length:138 start_codon:yes stop_codon:yes gene_type:complete